MSNNILVCGVGQLGRRYLEGILNVQKKINLYVYDISQTSLNNAEDHLNTISFDKSLYNIIFITNLSNLPKRIDISIISSTANARLEIIKLVDANSLVDYWIIEKNIAQNVNDVISIKNLLQKSKGAWVNTPRRMMNLYKEIKKYINEKHQPIIATMNGGLWGIACNAVHFIDLISFLTNSKLSKIDISYLDDQWHESKRKGFWDITGKLYCYFENESILILESKIDLVTTFEIKDNKFTWVVNEKDGIALRNDSIIINNKLLLQSELTPIIISSILNDGVCDLPNFNDSESCHEIFIKSMHNHWNKTSNINLKSVPIT